MSYTPHLWCVLKYTPKGEKPWYRLYAGWRGGYAGSDEWRMNSGITKIELEGDLYKVHGMSGSCYHCYQDLERDPPGWLGSVLYGIQQHALERDIVIEMVSVKQAIEEMKNA